MRRLFLIITYFLPGSIGAQPEPCNPNAMTSTCLDACVVCDIDGFTGRNNLTIQGQTFSGFCTTIFHNMSYIAFIAGTENLTINVSVTNCTSGRGIEVGIFESLDCQTFTPVTVCNTDVPANGSATFSNLVPLVIGQHYYLIMDGSMGDNGKLPDPNLTKAIGCGIKSAKSGDGNRRQGPPNGDRRQPPSADELLKMMDKNNDQKISKAEATRPLQNDFGRVDINGDGLFTKEELSKIGPPKG